MKTYPIYPIFDTTNKTAGSGAMIGDLFITAGHVIKRTPDPHLVVNGRIILFAPSRMLCLADEGKEGGLDLAIYRMPELRSNLTLFDGMLEPKTVLKSISYIPNSDGHEPSECEAEVVDFPLHSYFGATTSAILRNGTSGSPVLTNNMVAGILSLGNVDSEDENGNLIQCNENYSLNYCVFLSSKAILDLIKNNNFEVKKLSCISRTNVFIKSILVRVKKLLLISYK